jgi:hypothetical protein
MSAQLFANNASSTLNAGINTTDTSIVLASGGGTRFPSPTGGDFFKLTLTQPNSETSWEIVCIVGRSGDTLTVGIPGSAAANVAGRGYDGTSAAAWSAADKAEHRFTAKDIVVRASQCLIENNVLVSENYTLQAGCNAFSVGPVSVAGGSAVTVPSGQRWVVL